MGYQGLVLVGFVPSHLRRDEAAPQMGAPIFCDGVISSLAEVDFAGWGRNTDFMLMRSEFGRYGSMCMCICMCRGPVPAVLDRRMR
jgi:hypothetical protein